MRLALVLFFAFGVALLAEPPAGSEALGDAGHYLRAKALLAPYVAAHPTDAEALYLLSQADGALGNLDASLKEAESALALDGSNAKYHAQIAAACGRLAQSAGLLKQLGYAKRVKKELDTALDLDPNCPHALYGLALFYYAAPSLLGGDKQKAQDAAAKLTRLRPVWGYLTQAKLAGERKDDAAEESFYKKALEADPKSYEATVKLATFYLGHNLAEAQRLARAALDLDSGQAEGWKILVQVDVARQCWDELRADLERARKAVPDDLAPYYSSALALEQSGHLLSWAADFLRLYMTATPEGNEPTLAEAEKSQKRLQTVAVRASLQ